MSQIDDAPAADKDHLEGLYGVTDELVRAVQEAIEEERPLDVAGPISRLHAADQADLLERLSTHERGILIAALGDRLDPDFFSHLDQTVSQEIQIGRAPRTDRVCQYVEIPVVDVSLKQHEIKIRYTYLRQNVNVRS